MVESLSTKLDALPPEESTGWCRWMHHAYEERCWRGGINFPGKKPEAVLLWEKIITALGPAFPGEDPIRGFLVFLAGKHAHSLGRATPREFLRLWDQLSPQERGRAFAGATHALVEISPDSGQKEWLDTVKSRSGKMEFDPLPATDAICNLLAAGLLDDFDLLDRYAERLGNASLPRSDCSGRPESTRFEKQLSQLSESALDRCLEAAVRVNHPRAVARSLEAGADPDLAIWCLERSYNELGSALSFAISNLPKQDSEASVTSQLLAGGASATGSEVELPNQPLFHAVRLGSFGIARRLLDQGAGFDGGLDLSKYGDSEEKWPLWDIRASADELDWIENHFADCLPLESDWNAVWFFKPNAQIVRHNTFLSSSSGKSEAALDFLEEQRFDFRATAHDIRMWIRWNDGESLARFFRLLGADGDALETAREFRRVFVE